MSLPATLSTLQQEISVLTEQLAPAGVDEASRCLNGLMDGGLMIPVSIQADDPIEEYRRSLIGVPVAGLRRAFVKLKRGEYENINLAFIPLPSELAAMARAEARMWREDLIRLRERERACVEQASQPEKIDEAGKARVNGLLAKFRAQSAARKAAASIPQEPMSDEKAEYYRRIMELNDAKDVTAEQAAYRRKIAMDLPDEERWAAE